jgi:hypothetical protein
LGPRCPYIHDASKVAVCRDFLRNGHCSQGQFCDLSHDLTYERIPACVHFLRGNCSKQPCKYPHVHVNPAAPICKVFTKLGYCSKGVSCQERHVFECPDYSETGKCDNPNCRLPHVDRAGQLRQQASEDATSNRSPQDTTSTDIPSEPPLEDSDVDSDDLDELMLDSEDIDQTLSQQQDFVHF